MDKELFYLDDCGYKTNENDIEEFHLTVRLLKQPITNCKLQLQFEVKTFTVPLKFNATYDVCKFLRDRKKNRVLKRFYDIYSRYMNANHSCPYDHDVFFRSLKQIPISVAIPWPNGEYRFLSSWIIDKKLRLNLGGILEFYNNSTKKGYFTKN
ncbi:uncharacterized protein LOC135959687 [Calliphora vicina]|uniref:uncharacterized protein LOC135959687 n=1 Tax=Calliphora vicina TaxID=7373 RepID=UPI00325B75FA